MIKLSNKEKFVLASNHYSDHFKNFSTDDNSIYFYGYCFTESGLHHYRRSQVSGRELFLTYGENCGVFCSVFEDNDQETVVFTDPLGQYPLFFYSHAGRFVVSNDFWLISNAVASGELNEDAIYDYVTYFSPLKQETLSKNVRRLTANQFLTIKKDPLGYSVALKEKEPVQYQGSYESLLEVASVRFKNRAESVLAVGTPVVHLSGGSDSRLSFSALASCGYSGPVFSFGTGASQDRLVHQALVDSIKLKQGPIKWFGGPINTTHKLLNAVIAFNGLKSNNLTNWGNGCDNSHLEVTGYFGEGLLKGFGQFWGPKGVATPYKYARTVSAFPSEVFDHAEQRIQSEAAILLDRFEGNLLLAETSYYLRNRSASHFGAHSVVNNRKFISIDIIYDPMLLSLLRACPYSDKAIKDGAILVDLIKLIHSEGLAKFPYDDRLITSYNQWSAISKEIGEFSCFSDLRLLQRDLPPLSVEIHPMDSTGSKFSVPESSLRSLEEIVSQHPFDNLLQNFPMLDITKLPKDRGMKRVLERVSLSGLASTYWLLNEKYRGDFSSQ